MEEIALTRVYQLNKRRSTADTDDVDDIQFKTADTSVIKTYTYFDLIRHWTIFLTAAMATLITPLLYYAIALQTNSGDSIYTTFALNTMADIPAVFLATYLVDRILRKKNKLEGLFLAGIFIAGLFFVPHSKRWSYGVNKTIAIFARLCHLRWSLHMDI